MKGPAASRELQTLCAGRPDHLIASVLLVVYSQLCWLSRGEFAIMPTTLARPAVYRQPQPIVGLQASVCYLHECEVTPLSQAVASAPLGSCWRDAAQSPGSQ
jgi:hypothetical protein